MMSMLTIHEWHNDAGVRETVEVGAEDGALLVRVAGVGVLLPMNVLERVMERYGKPLADGVPLEGPHVDLGDGATLYRIRHKSFYDVIARDFLVWTSPGRDSLAELATAISAALVHFAEVAHTAEAHAAG
jgi:hypothetical protein